MTGNYQVIRTSKKLVGFAGQGTPADISTILAAFELYLMNGMVGRFLGAFDRVTQCRDAQYAPT